MGAPDIGGAAFGDANMIAIIAGSAGGGVLLLIGAIVTVVCFKRRSRSHEKRDSSSAFTTPQQSVRSSDSLSGTEMHSARADYASFRVINPSDDYDSGNIDRQTREF
jgi:hypothetical protein